jgi:hypothetical protein
MQIGGTDSLRKIELKIDTFLNVTWCSLGLYKTSITSPSSNLKQVYWG